MIRFPRFLFKSPLKGVLGTGLAVPIPLLLLDQFNTARSAGTINGTPAEPGVGNRTTVDTNSKLTIASGKLTFSGAAVVPTHGDPGLWEKSFPRVSGRTLFIQITPADTAQYFISGWDEAPATGSPSQHGIYFYAGLLKLFNGNVVGANIGSGYSAGQSYVIGLTLLSSGVVLFIKGGAQYTDWTYLTETNTPSAANLLPEIGSYSGIFTSDYLAVYDLPEPFKSNVGVQSGGVFTANALTVLNRINP